MRACALLATALLGLSLPCASHTLMGEAAGGFPGSLPALSSPPAYLPPERFGDRHRPSPASKALGGHCPSVDVAALEGDDLIGHLRATPVSRDCLFPTWMWWALASDDRPTVFSDRNLHSVIAEIEEVAATYDGTNRAGLGQLLFFLYSALSPSTVGRISTRRGSCRTKRIAPTSPPARYWSPTTTSGTRATRRPNIQDWFFLVASEMGLQSHLASIKRFLAEFTAEKASSG